jgi:hypothetical protein
LRLLSGRHAIHVVVIVVSHGSSSSTVHRLDVGGAERCSTRRLMFDWRIDRGKPIETRKRQRRAKTVVNLKDENFRKNVVEKWQANFNKKFILLEHPFVERAVRRADSCK